MPENTIKLKNAAGTVIQCTEETAVRLSPVWKPVKGRSSRGTTTGRATKPSTKRKGSSSKPASTPAEPEQTAEPEQKTEQEQQPATGAAPAQAEGPDSKWTVKQLREFAAENDIELGDAKKPAEILAVIDRELTAGNDDDLEDDETDDSDESDDTGNGDDEEDTEDGDDED